MPATLTPIECDCGRLCGYEIRAGVAHHSISEHDPYEVAGFAKKKKDGSYIIGPLAGELYRGFVADIRKAFKLAKVRRVCWERAKKHGLKDVTETVAKGESKWS